MNKVYLLILMVLFSPPGFSTESWLCTEEGAVQEGHELSVCGIGESMTEGAARSSALKNAIEEAVILCDLSSSCRGHKTTVLPKRTTCSQDKQGVWKCFRMILVSIEK